VPLWNWFDLLIIALAAWRLAYLLTKESAPFNLMGRFRTRYPLGGLLTCIYCASVWTALLCMGLYLTPLAPVVWIFAISGGALMLASWTGANHG
jgi:hypothetical protein